MVRLHPPRRRHLPATAHRGGRARRRDPGLSRRARGVEAVRRHDGLLYLLNHTDRPQRVPAAGFELLTGATVDGEWTVAPGGVAVVREETP
ncbi:Beta-galactosidase C-terminal domain [Micromonospora sp. BRA006-A]|nr:Beta-galactosidase C-terminal domain [Micromonospora sp. BRA006-A]